MQTRPHFRLFGIPIRVEPVFWVVAVFLGLNLQDPPLIITWVVVVFVSVLVHELGHALALKIFGQSSSIVLHGFGGLTFSQRRLRRGQSILVSLAGPATALVFLGVPAYLVRESDYGNRLHLDYLWSNGGFGLWPVIVFAAWANLWWSAFNLLPVRPLDGGNVMTELLGAQRARLLSVVVGVAAAVWAYTHTTDFQMAGFFLGFLAFVNFSEYRRASQGVRAPSTFDIEAPPVNGGGGGVRPGSETPSVVSRRRGHRRDATPTALPAPVGPIDPRSAERLAWSLLRNGDTRGASAAVARASDPVDPFLLGTLTAVTTGAVDALVAAYRSRPEGPSNLVVAQTADTYGYLSALVDGLLTAPATGAEAVHSIQTHLHYADRFAASAQVGEALHPHSTARAQVAFDVATALTRAGDPDRAITWVGRAIDEGFSAASLLDGEPDLAPLRSRADWAAIRHRLET